MGRGKSVGNSVMEKLQVVILLYPMLALGSAASWGYRDIIKLTMTFPAKFLG